MSAPVAAPRALAVGGLDPSVGAGVLLDAFVMSRLGYQPAVVVTTVTAQNSASFAGAWPVEPETLIAQLEAVLAEGSFSCVKVGALGSDVLALAVGEWLVRADLPAVVSDPVLASSSGGSLVEGAVRAVDMVARVSTLITPNAEEAAHLAAVDGVANADAAVAAARTLASRYGSAVCVTGLPGSSPAEAVDVLVLANGSAVCATHPLVAGVGDVRGTGCMLSSALACHLARRLSPVDALAAAHATVRDLLGCARSIGQGRWQVDLARLVQPWEYMR
ncbi:MAG: bifunctional hydroxymethylpyrimidine kinase/phosphomethylpyrimidine kinase [Actinomycetota bacterium]|nr:bifunctional hydroxymethylpyrimidine kinase/phosphomethylpyrimidine kinase [Actinomycetota bacterium]